MAINTFDLLRKGTTHPDVARNWHLQGVINKAHKEIEALTDLIHKLDENDVYSDALKLERSESLDILRSFLAKWPAPTTKSIVDEIALTQRIEDGTSTFMQARPLKPLTCIHLDKSSGFIVYLDNEDDSIIKVPNIHYNQPNRARQICFGY